MRKTVKKIMALCMASSAVLSASACATTGGQLIQEIDTSKTQIYVDVYNGGNGCEWIKTLAKDFNALYDDSGYEVIIIDEHKYSIEEIQSDIQYGTDVNIYFTAESSVKKMALLGYLEDLSDVYQMKPDGEDGKTIEQKLRNPELAKKIYAGQNMQGLYGLPYSESWMGLIYEHERFLENGWYNFATESDAAALTAQGIVFETSGTRLKFVSATGETNYVAGDYILTCGKDGKYGTYDDGQPQTIAEFDTLMKKIKSKTGYPLLWAGAQPGYLDPIIAGMYAQYDGLDNFAISYTYDGTYVSPTTGEQTVITPDKGYEIYNVSEGFEESVEFFDTYFAPDDTKYIHPFATKGSTSHRDAQDKYIFGFENKGEVYLTGLLVEGTWWENEAKAGFNSLVVSGETDRGFGSREYRYLMYPKMENQKGIDGNGNGTVFAIQDSGCVLLKKDSNRELIEWAKKFIAYTTSDESLRYFTKSTGVVRPYNYEMTEVDKAEMTGFQKNVWTMYNDSENIAFVSPLMTNNLCSINFASEKSKWMFYSEFKSSPISYPLKALEQRGVTASDWISEFRSYSKTNWNKWYTNGLEAWGGLL